MTETPNELAEEWASLLQRTLALGPGASVQFLIGAAVVVVAGATDPSGIARFWPGFIAEVERGIENMRQT